MIHAGGTFIAILTVAVAFWVIPYGWRLIERITGRQPAGYLDPEDEETREIARALHPAWLARDDAELWAEMDAFERAAADRLGDGRDEQP